MKPKTNISKGKVFSEMTGIHDLEVTKELDEHARTKLSIGCPNNQKQFPLFKTNLQDSFSLSVNGFILVGFYLKVRKILFKTNKLLNKN